MREKKVSSGQICWLDFFFSCEELNGLESIVSHSFTIYLMQGVNRHCELYDFQLFIWIAVSDMWHFQSHSKWLHFSDLFFFFWRIVRHWALDIFLFIIILLHFNFSDWMIHIFFTHAPKIMSSFHFYWSKEEMKKWINNEKYGQEANFARPHLKWLTAISLELMWNLSFTTMAARLQWEQWAYS